MYRFISIIISYKNDKFLMKNLISHELLTDTTFFKGSKTVIA